jgi:signal transduction histidine kinase
MIGNQIFGVKGEINELEYLVSRGRLTPETLSGIVDSLNKGVRRLEEIMGEFREFLKADQLTLQQCDANELIRQAVEASFPKRSNVWLQLRLADDLPTITADAAKLQRCLTELIENSVGFQPKGGRLSISTSLAGLSPMPGGRGRPGKYVQIELEDEGPGVPTEDKKRIFDAFFSTRSKGMGLGLSIVKGIIDAHRGRISEVGEAGVGAKFRILLPCS